MKKLTCVSSLLMLALMAGCDRHGGGVRPSTKGPPAPPTFSSFDPLGTTNEIPAHAMRFVDADLLQILALYQELSSRSIIRSPAVPANIKISFENTTAMSRVEALQALDTILAAQQIVMVYLGARYVKVVPAAQVPQEAGPVVEGPWEELPESSSFVTYIAKLKYIAPEHAVSALQPFAKLPNSIVGVKGNDVIILRDYSANVRRMMQVLEMTDKPGTNFWTFPKRK